MMEEADKPRFKIIPADESHIEQMVDCHVAAFPGEFTTQLGRGYLRQSHRFYMRHPGGIALVSVDEVSGRVAGFVKGGAPQIKSQLARKVLLRVAIMSIWRSIVSGRFRSRMMYHLGRVFGKVAVKLRLAKASSQPAEPPAEPPGTWSNLISVCTHPDFRGHKVGLSLMDAFRHESRRRGYRTMRLSVHNDNEPAKALYTRAGWQAVLTVPSGTYFKRSVGEAE